MTDKHAITAREIRANDAEKLSIVFPSEEEAVKWKKAYRNSCGKWPAVEAIYKWLRDQAQLKAVALLMPNEEWISNATEGFTPEERLGAKTIMVLVRQNSRAITLDDLQDAERLLDVACKNYPKDLGLKRGQERFSACLARLKGEK